jgi:hypothetical protein
MGETFYKVLVFVLWLFAIPYDIASAFKYCESGSYYRCGWFIMLAALGLMIIAKYLFVG